jgi:hypothetical protein
MISFCWQALKPPHAAAVAAGDEPNTKLQAPSFKHKQE